MITFLEFLNEAAIDVSTEVNTLMNTIWPAITPIIQRYENISYKDLGEQQHKAYAFSLELNQAVAASPISFQVEYPNENSTANALIYNASYINPSSTQRGWAKFISSFWKTKHSDQVDLLNTNWTGYNVKPLLFIINANKFDKMNANVFFKELSTTLSHELVHWQQYLRNLGKNRTRDSGNKAVDRLAPGQPEETKDLAYFGSGNEYGANAMQLAYALLSGNYDDHVKKVASMMLRLPQQDKRRQKYFQALYQILNRQGWSNELIRDKLNNFIATNKNES